MRHRTALLHCWTALTVQRIMLNRIKNLFSFQDTSQHILVNAYCTVAEVPKPGFPHVLNARRDLSDPELQPRSELVNPALDWLAEMKSDEFRQHFRGSPIRRTKLNGLRRNAVIAMGNSGNREFIPALEKLRADEDPVIAESAAWAVEKLHSL